MKLAILPWRCDIFPSVAVLRKRANSSPDDMSGGIASCSAEKHQGAIRQQQGGLHVYTCPCVFTKFEGFLIRGQFNSKWCFLCQTYVATRPPQPETVALLLHFLLKSHESTCRRWQGGRKRMFHAVLLLYHRRRGGGERLGVFIVAHKTNTKRVR